MSADDDIQTAIMYFPEVQGIEAYKAEAKMEIAESYLLNKQYGLFLDKLSEVGLFFGSTPRFEMVRSFSST